MWKYIQKSEINISEYERLIKIFPQLPKFETDNKNTVKIPAAYILEKLGWRIEEMEMLGTWIYHPLIVTNYGNGSAKRYTYFYKKVEDDF